LRVPSTILVVRLRYRPYASIDATADAICSTLLTAKSQLHQTGNNGAKTALAGWGARIRTGEWRNQNRVLYVLLQLLN